MAEERLFYLLAYDICDDRRRAKIARLLESLGARVQGSVFEAYLTQPELEKLISRSRKVMQEKEDSLRVYFLCAQCRKKVRMIGAGKVTPAPGVVIV